MFVELKHQGAVHFSSVHEGHRDNINEVCQCVAKFRIYLEMSIKMMLIEMSIKH